jgi:hypothetical protein
MFFRLPEIILEDFILTLEKIFISLTLFGCAAEYNLKTSDDD